MGTTAAIIGIFIYIIILLVFIGMWIFAFILFVKLARRGIKALDIYIDGKSNNNKGSSDYYIDDNAN